MAIGDEQDRDGMRRPRCGSYVGCEVVGKVCVESTEDQKIRGAEELTALLRKYVGGRRVLKRLVASVLNLLTIRSEQVKLEEQETKDGRSKLAGLLSKHVSNKEQLTRLHAQVKCLRTEQTELEECMREWLRTVGLESARAECDDGRSRNVTVSSRVVFKVTHMDALLRYARETGNDHILGRTVYNQSINEILADGNDLPPGIESIELPTTKITLAGA